MSPRSPEFSISSGLAFNQEKHDADYLNGVDLHVGVVGYAYQQVTGDSGAGATLGDFKSSVYGIGPQVGYMFPSARCKAIQPEELCRIRRQKPAGRLESVADISPHPGRKMTAPGVSDCIEIPTTAMIKRHNIWAGGLALLSICALATAAQAQEKAAAPDNGTDPSRISNSFITDFKYLSLRDDFTSEVIDLKFTAAVARHTGLSIDLPVASIDTLGNNDYGIGDFSFKASHVSGMSKKGANVFQAELFLDTADRPELGNGQDVLKLTYIKVIFLPTHAIIAPSFIQNFGFGGKGDRARVNNFVFDLYYVPHFKNPKLYMTIDPNITYNWDTGSSYEGLLVTVGYGLGKAFGKGNGSVYVKPSVYFGDDRPADWGMEVGYRLLAFDIRLPVCGHPDMQKAPDDPAPFAYAFRSFSQVRRPPHR